MKKRPLALLLAVFLAAAAGGYLYTLLQAAGRLPVITIDKQNGYKMTIDNKRFIIKGACYSPVPVGKDYEYNFWGDSGKPWITDGRRMKEMGVNTVRFYRVGKNPAEVKQVLDDLYKKYGIRSLVGNYLGFWNWPPPNYADDGFREKIRQEVMEMVRLYKDSPGVLMWVLGNENNYSFDRNVQKWSTDDIDAMPSPEEQRIAKAKIYYGFVNTLAQEIKKIDSRHPVVLGVGEVASLDVAAEMCHDIDAIGMIAYRGPGFGNLFRQVQQKFDKPVVMTEWGADSFNAYTREPDESSQADFLKHQWEDIERNTDAKKGVGNVLGGTFFEWTDEWWKGNENLPHTWNVQDTAGHWNNPAYYYDAEVADHMNMNEEWWGVVKLNPKKLKSGIQERTPKEAYATLKALWAGSKKK